MVLLTILSRLLVLVIFSGSKFNRPIRVDVSESSTTV